MSVYVVPALFDLSALSFSDQMASLNDVYDPHGRDGEWHAIVKLPHEVVEWEGRGVPLFGGDVERMKWQGRRRCRNTFANF